MESEKDLAPTFPTRYLRTTLELDSGTPKESRSSGVECKCLPIKEPDERPPGRATVTIFQSKIVESVKPTLFHTRSKECPGGREWDILGIMWKQTVSRSQSRLERHLF